MPFASAAIAALALFTGAAAPPPDLLDAETAGEGLLVLGSGGAVYRLQPGGGFVVETVLPSHATDLAACKAGALAVGPAGLAARKGPESKWSSFNVSGSPSFWGVDVMPDCTGALAVGEKGAIFELGAGEATGVASASTADLYAVAVTADFDLAAGAAGTLLLRPHGRGAFSRLEAPPDATFLAAKHFGRRTLLAGLGALYELDGDSLHELVRVPSEVFVRIATRGDREAVVVGQTTALVTDDGGRRWRTVPLAGMFSAGAVSPGLFLAMGPEGRTSWLSTKEADGNPVPVSRRLLAPSREPVKATKPEPVTDAGMPVVAAKRDVLPELEPVKPAAGCYAAPKLDASATGFIDIKAVGGKLLVASADGTIRRADLKGLPVVMKVAGANLLGLAVSADQKRVAAVGKGALLVSSDSGESFRPVQVPADFYAYAIAYSGDELVIADVYGNVRRLLPGQFALASEPALKPRAVTFWSIHFPSAGRGFLVGQCGTLLETRDGGKTWGAIEAPEEKLEGVLFANGGLYVSGYGGVYLRGRGETTFRHVLKNPSGCVRMASRGEAVAAACNDGETHQGLRYAKDGQNFVPVPAKPGAIWLIAVAFGREGGLTAVGASELVIQGTPEGAAMAFNSEATKHFDWVMAALLKERKVAKGEVKQLPPKPAARR